MLDWVKRWTARKIDVVTVTEPRMRATPAMTGKYQALHKYLENRYATTVVLRLTEIEDLLGFKLPPPARTNQEWWTSAENDTPEGNYSQAWTLARRSAQPNLPANIVVFERLS